MHDPRFYANLWKIIGRSLSGVYNTYSGRIYYQAAPIHTEFPVLVYQTQINRSHAVLMLNDSYWEGLVTFRSISTSLNDAQERLTTLVEKITSQQIVTLSGFSYPFSLRYIVNDVPSFPVERISESYIYTAAITMETNVFPNN